MVMKFHNLDSFYQICSICDLSSVLAPAAWKALKAIGVTQKLDQNAADMVCTLASKVDDGILFSDLVRILFRCLQYFASFPRE